MRGIVFLPNSPYSLMRGMVYSSEELKRQLERQDQRERERQEWQLEWERERQGWEWQDQRERERQEWEREWERERQEWEREWRREREREQEREREREQQREQQRLREEQERLWELERQAKQFRRLLALLKVLKGVVTGEVLLRKNLHSLCEYLRFNLSDRSHSRLLVLAMLLFALFLELLGWFILVGLFTTFCEYALCSMCLMATHGAL